MNKKEKFFLEKLIKRYSKKKEIYKSNYPLLENAFSLNDILSGIKVLLSIVVKIYLSAIILLILR